MKRSFWCLVIFALLLPATIASASEPKSGGTFTMSIEAEPPMLDPAFETSMLVASIVDLTYEFLWRWDKTFSNFDARVADSWKWIDDTHFQLHVRPGVKFHNGREVTAEDVKYTIDRILEPKTGSPKASYLAPIASVIANNKSTVTINLKHPWFGLQDMFARHVAIVPREVVQQYGDLKTHPVGCGPFKLESWEPGLQMKFTKFKDYYVKGRPYLDAVVLKFMPEYNTSKNALLSKQVDAINWPDEADLGSLESIKGLELHPFGSNSVMYCAINTSHPPLDNILVRKAIALATSRDAYNSALYRGRAEIAYSPVKPGTPYYKKTWEYSKDIAKAKQLLTQAGYPNGFSIHILALKSPEEIMGEVLQADLAAIGIEGIIDVREVPVALDLIFKKGDFDFALLGDTTSPADPGLFLSVYFIPGGAGYTASGKWDNPQVRELYQKASSTLDMPTRVKTFQQLYDIISDQVPMIFLAYPIRAPVTWNYVKGWFAWSDLRYDWHNFWLDK